MIKKLTAKTQELNPKLPQYASSFSKCLTIKAEDQEMLLKKGTLYITFDVSGDSNFDTELVGKVIYDVIHDSYFSSESISPVQSMEKSILETKEKIMQLSSDTLTANPQSIVLNILAAVLWGNVLYIVQFGSQKCYTVKEGGVIPLEMTTEGNFSTFSKIVDEDEVLIFCTVPFEQAVPPDKLLTSSLTERDLAPNQSCMLMRLIIDTSFSQDEVIDFGLGQAVAINKTRVQTEQFVDKLKAGGLWVLKLIKKIALLIKASFAKLIKKIPRRKAALITRNITQLTTGRNSKTKSWIFLSIATILVSVLVFFGIKSLVFKTKQKPTNENQLVTSQPTPTPIPSEDTSKDPLYKITRVKPEVFYDIKISDPQAEASDIQVVGDKLVAVDKTTGKMFISDIGSPSFKTGAATFPGIRSLANFDGLLSFNDDIGYKTFNLKTMAVDKSYTVDGLSLTFPYASFVYATSGDSLMKETIKGGALDGSIWARNPDFVNARSMAIAFNVYLLKFDGELVSFSGGIKNVFPISGLEKEFSDTTKVSADTDWKYIYIANRGGKSIVLIDDKGVVFKQYKFETSDKWSDIRSITVSPDEKVLFVLNGSEIYKVSMN